MADLGDVTVPLTQLETAELLHAASRADHQLNDKGRMQLRRLAFERDQLREKLAKLDGRDDHPEHRCEKCGGRNITWFIASKHWNSHAGDHGVLCPICFAELAEAGGLAPTAWQLSPENIDAEEALAKLQQAVATHRNQKADDRCWMDDAELYQAAGLETHDAAVGDPAAMLENCKRFIERRCRGGKWPSYAALEAVLEKLPGLLIQQVRGDFGRPVVGYDGKARFLCRCCGALGPREQLHKPESNCPVAVAETLKQENQ